MIQLSQVGVSFQEIKKIWIFRHLSLQIQEGQTLGLKGKSGSGKTVLLRTIAGLQNPTEGKVLLKSQEVGMLFQKNALFDSLTVQENLYFPLRERLRISGVQTQHRVKEMLEAVELTHAKMLYPDEISGGMQKRLGIARALIVEPKILLYDEPTAGLDPITSRTIGALIKKLNQARGTTSVIVSNEPARLKQLCDHIFCLDTYERQHSI